MIEIGQAVYFIESRGLDPVIKFGIVTLVEVGTYECHTAESSTTTAQLQPQKKNTTDLTLYTDPEAPIKRGDILYIYELDEYDKPIMSTEFKAIADKPYKKRTQLIVSLLSEEEV